MKLTLKWCRWTDFNEGPSLTSSPAKKFFILFYRVALPVNLHCHSIYMDQVLPDLRQVMPPGAMGLQVIKHWWPVHHLRLTWVNYKAKKRQLLLFSIIFFCLVLSTGLRSPLYSLTHTQYPYSMLGAADQLAAW